MNITEKAIEYAKNKQEGFDGGHDWSHSERVLNTCRYIQRKEAAGDIEVIELAAILHDIADTKFHKGSESDGGDMAYDYLLKLGLSAVKAEHIRLIINSLSFKNSLENTYKKSIEFQIVQDSDRLDAMGAVGIARAFNYGGLKNRALYDPEIKPQTYTSTEEYKKSTAPTLNHFYEKLFLLKDLMNTKTGRELAEERHEYMLSYVERFKDEWRGIR